MYVLILECCNLIHKDRNGGYMGVGGKGRHVRFTVIIISIQCALCVPTDFYFVSMSVCVLSMSHSSSFPFIIIIA